MLWQISGLECWFAPSDREAPLTHGEDVKQIYLADGLGGGECSDGGTLSDDGCGVVQGADCLENRVADAVREASCKGNRKVQLAVL